MRSVYAAVNAYTQIFGNDITGVGRYFEVRANVPVGEGGGRRRSPWILAVSKRNNLCTKMSDIFI